MTTHASVCPTKAAGRAIVAAVGAASALGACGIDQGGFEVQTTAVSPTTTLVSGPVTGFGSILVNGLRLETDGAEIRIDGSPATESDLREGQVIRAVVVREGTRLRALVVEHEENVVGPIAALDATDGSLSVLGQRIVTDDATRFDGAQLAGFDDLMAGDPIAVSGLKLPGDAILATYIGRADPAAPAQVTARITDLDPDGLTFDLGGLTIDYSQTALLQVPDGAPELDLVVEVRGDVLASGVLLATEIRSLPTIPGLFDASGTTLTSVEQPIAAAAGASTQLAANFIGFITDTNLPGRISLGDIDVAVDGAPLVGGTAGDLIPGARVQVEGSISTLGQIAAERVTLL